MAKALHCRQRIARSFKRGRSLATFLSLAALSVSAKSETYDFTGTAGGSYSWITGTGWTPALQSGPGGELRVYNGMRVGEGSAEVKLVNDFLSDFQLTSLQLRGTGALTSGTTNITLEGRRLHFVADGETNPSITSQYVTSTGKVLSYTIANSIQSSSPLTVQSVNPLTIQGSLMGDFDLTKTGAGTLTLYGLTGHETFFRGNVTSQQGSILIDKNRLFDATSGGIRLPTLVTSGTLIANAGATINSGQTMGFAVGWLGGSGTIGGGTFRGIVNNSQSETNVFEGTLGNRFNLYKGGVGTLEIKNQFAVNGSGTIYVYGGRVLTPYLSGTQDSSMGIMQGTLQLTGTGVTRGSYTNLVGATGVLTLFAGGTLALTPTGGAASEDLVITGNASGQTRPSGGSLVIDRGDWGSLTVQFESEIAVQQRGGLLLQAAGGLSALGVTERVRYTTAPVLYSGMVAGQWVGLDNDAHLSANFLEYDDTAGFRQISAFDLTNAIDASTATSKVDIKAGQTVTMGGAKDIHALRVGGTLDLGGYALSFKRNTAVTNSGVGIILNGGTIQNGEMKSDGEVSIYTSLQNGTFAGNYTASSDITKNGEGTLFFTGSGSSSGSLNINGGAIRFINTSATRFNTNLTGLVRLQGGVLETNGSLTRDLGSSTSRIAFTGYSGGFSAGGGDLTVNIGGGRRTLMWSNVYSSNGTTGGGINSTYQFLSDGAALLLNSRTADGHVNLVNHLDLGGSTGFFERVIDVRKGISGTSSAELSGNISSIGYANGVVKSGAGTLTLSGTNTFQGDLTVAAGTLKAGSEKSLSVSGNRVKVNQGATLDLNGQTIAAGKRIVLNGEGDGSLGALVNNSTTAAVLGDGITLNVLESSGTWDLSEGVPQITITGGDGTGAAATVNGLVVREVLVTNSGTYGGTSAVPTVTITGGLKDATAFVRSQNNAGGFNGPSSVNVTDAGLYAENPVVTFSGGTSPTQQATGVANLALNLAGITIEAGEGYTVAPTVTVTGGGGQGVIQADVGGIELASDSKVGGSGDLWVKPVISGTGKLTKIGAGTLTLSGSNRYSGGTQIDAGRIVANHQHALGSGAASISNGGALLIGATAAVGNQMTLNGTNARLIVSGTVTGNLQFGGDGGRLEGSGRITSSVSLNDTKQTLAPGNSPGALTFDSAQNWSALTYEWQLNQWGSGAVAGTNFDQLVLLSPLTLSSEGNYVLKIQSLTSGNVAGALDGFSETSQEWVIIAASDIANFNAERWELNTSGFSTPDQWTGTWSLEQNASGLVLQYQVIPEPSSFLFVIGGGALLYCLRRKKVA